jgi:leucine-rich repeat protein SHOC2
MEHTMKRMIWVGLSALLIGGCSPSDQFWTKPDVGEKVTSLDAAAKQAATVRNLDLYRQNLQGFPPQVLSLTALERLSLRRNAIGTVPAGITTLTKVTWLDLGQAGLTELNPAIGRMAALQTVYLNDNLLTSLPASLADLAALTYLNADRNKLTSLPNELGRLSSLKWLRLNGNQLTALPADLTGWSKSLKRLYLRGNPLPEPEKERIRKALPACDVIF